MVDTHAHLNFSYYADKIEKTVSESKNAGLKAIIIASSNLGDSKRALALAKKYPAFLYASVGLHPQKTDPENSDSIEIQLANLEKLITYHQSPITGNRSLITAIGETGLDFSPAPPEEEDRSPSEQEKLFRGQADLAIKHKLPILIHAREATDEVIKVIKSYHNSSLKGVFHCYSGGKKRISKILDLQGEWYFGFDGNLTYDKGLQNILSLVPEERILIETDSPFLTPVPHRGELNTPAYLPLIMEKINEILGQRLVNIIENNTQKLFFEK